MRAKQVKKSKAKAKNFKPVPALKAFFSLRVQMEKYMIKPQFESNWQGAGHNFILCTPGLREVMEHDRFIAFWVFLYLVDQTVDTVVKSESETHVRRNVPSVLPLLHPLLTNKPQ